MPDGRRLLVLGLDAENMARLSNDEPIYKRLDGADGPDGTEGVLVEGLESWDVTIIGPEDLERFVARYAPAAERP